MSGRATGLPKASSASWLPRPSRPVPAPDSCKVIAQRRCPAGGSWCPDSSRTCVCGSPSPGPETEPRRHPENRAASWPAPPRPTRQATAICSESPCRRGWPGRALLRSASLVRHVVSEVRPGRGCRRRVPRCRWVPWVAVPPHGGCLTAFRTAAERGFLPPFSEFRAAAVSPVVCVFRASWPVRGPDSSAFRGRARCRHSSGHNPSGDREGPRN